MPTDILMTQRKRHMTNFFQLGNYWASYVRTRVAGNDGSYEGTVLQRKGKTRQNTNKHLPLFAY